MPDDSTPANPLAETPRLSTRSLLIVIAFASAFLLPALGGFRVLTQHEVFAAQPAREMAAGGDWILPDFAGVPRLVKPPGMGWLIATSITIFQSRSEWVVRLPAALAGVLTAVLIALFAGRWRGDRIGLVAGLMQASFVYVLMQARLAEADMGMCAAVTLAMVAFALGTVDETPSRSSRKRLALVLLFHLGMGLSAVLKGVGPVFILAGCIGWIVLNRRWRALRFLFHPLGLLLLLIVAGAWPLAAWLRMPGIVSIWRRETIGRAGGEFGDPEPWYIYFWAVPMLLLPWLPFAIRGVGEWLGQPRRIDRRLSFLACWFAGGMVILLSSAARHKHYSIPMLPPITLLAAGGFVALLGDMKAGTATGRRRSPVVAGAVALFAGTVVVAALAIFLKQGRIEVATTAGLAAVGIAAIATLSAARRPNGVLVATFATMLVGGLAFQFLVIPKFDDYKASAQLARRTNQIVPAGQPVALMMLGEAHAAFYLDHPLIRVDRQRELVPFLQKSAGQDIYALCPETTKPILQKSAIVTELDRVDHARRNETAPMVLVRIRLNEGKDPVGP